MSSRKISLADLAQKSAPPVTPAAVAQAEPVETISEPPRSAPEQRRRSARPKADVASRGLEIDAQSAEAAPGEWVRFDQYERKEARLRPDQYERLSAVSRNLNRVRNGRGERITENTLIRVAIDLLLERGGDVAGTTEAEIRRSVGL